MRNLLSRIVFNAPDGGGGGAPGGGSEPPAGGAGDPPASPPAGGNAPPPPSAGAPPAGAGDPPAGDFYKPEGLPDHLLGKDQNETMDKLANALKGYRERDTNNGVPETPEAYADFKGEISETVKPHLETLTKDPLFSRVSDKALEMKLSVPQYQALVQEFMSVSAEMGLLEPVVDEKAERAALVPEAAKHLTPAEQQQAVEKRMNDNYAFLDAMVARGAEGGGLSKDDAEFAKAMLGDSAKGHRFFEWLRNSTGGGAGTGGPRMEGPAPGGNDPRKELARRAALPENTWGNPKFDQKSYEALQADYARLIPDN